jgi:hypothetical protein
MLSRLNRSLASWLAVVTFAVLSTAVDAAVIRAKWDPDFGGVFTGTGFRGTAKFFVPDACLPSGVSFTGFILDTDTCSDGGMYLIEANATLYDDEGTEFDFTDDIDLVTIIYAPPDLDPDPIIGLWVDWDGSRLLDAALETALIGPQPSGIDPLLAPSNLYLQFSYQASLLNEEDPDYLPVGAYLIGCTFGDDEVCSVNPEQRSNPATVFYTPEPGSLALLLAALGAGWLTRRRTAID